MRNDVEKPEGGVPRSARINGIIPNYVQTLSGYLRTVSSGASTVASSVRSAGASVASSIADRIDDSSGCDQVHWAGFNKLECEGNCPRQVLLLGYRSGFQVWDVEEADNVRELVSIHDGPVSFLQMQPKPIASKSSRDKFADVRPLLVVVGDGFICGGGTVQDGSALPRHGNATSYLEPGNDIFIPSVVQFYSLKSQSYVHVLKFRSVVYSVRCSSRVVAISQAAQIYCFDAATLEMEYTLLTYPLVSNSLGAGNIGCGPLAVGPRWLAYSGSPVTVSNTGRVSPQHLTRAASFSGSPLNGSYVAHYARESSKQFAAGIVTLGDIGYKKLSRYCSELLPDSNSSSKSGSPSWIANDNGHLTDADGLGMVIVRDIVSKSVVAQFRAHRNPISALCFDPSGTLLVTASVQGHNINVFRIMPTQMGSSSALDSDGSYAHLYKLQRGFTNAVIQDISFSEDSCWIMISSSRGTNHLFAISSSGGEVVHSTDASATNINHGLGPASKSVVGQPPSPGSAKFNQQSVCASGPPITLSAVSRIKNGNNGWRGTVSGAAAAATGRVSSLCGATASAFHNCKGNNTHPDTGLSRTKYHLLVFSPSGSIIQYVLRLSSGPVSEQIVSDAAVLYDCAPDSDARLVIEALQKWDICQSRSRREREDNSDVYGDYANGDSSKLFPEGIKTGVQTYSSAKGTGTKKTKSEERNHLYISEAELQMHQTQNPLWLKREIYFQTVVMDGYDTENVSGGEIEIERVPVSMIEARSNNLIPVYDYIQTHKLQQLRLPALDSNQSRLILHEKSGMSEDGRLSCRCSCSSLDSMSESGAAVSELHHGIQDNGWHDFRMSKQPSDHFVNSNDIPKVKTQLGNVYNTERPTLENNVESVNNNKESLKEDNHLDDDGSGDDGSGDDDDGSGDDDDDCDELG